MCFFSPVGGMKKHGNWIFWYLKNPEQFSGWWFQKGFIFIPIWGRFPFWPIFFKGVETTNQFFKMAQLQKTFSGFWNWKIIRYLKKDADFQNLIPKNPCFLPQSLGKKNLVFSLFYNKWFSHKMMYVYLLFILYDGRNNWWFSSPFRAHWFVFLFEGFFQWNQRQGGQGRVTLSIWLI